jgi:hypothetical protein
VSGLTGSTAVKDSDSKVQGWRGRGVSSATLTEDAAADITRSAENDFYRGTVTSCIT